MPLDISAPRVFAPSNGWEYVLPPPLPRRIRVLLGKSLRHRDGAVPSFQILFPEGSALSKLSAKRVYKCLGKQRPSIFFALALPDRDLLVLKIQVFHPEPKPLREPKSRPVEQTSHEPVRALHLPEYRCDLVLGEHHRKPLRFLGAIEVRHLVPVGTEHVAMEKEKGTEGLVLG